MTKEKIIETLQALISTSQSMYEANKKANDLNAAQFENGQINAFKLALSMVKKNEIIQSGIQ
jgi:hypothetical protein